MTQKRVLIIGPTPPPYHGVAISTQLLLQAPQFKNFELIHLDTSDRRSIENIGAFEWGNILLGLWHFMQFMAILIRQRPSLIYLPISQGTGGFLRDSLFLLPCRWFGIPTVVHLRGSEFRSMFYEVVPPILQRFIRYSLGAVTRMVVLGHCLRDMFAGLIPSERVVVVPNGENDFVLPIGLINKPKESINGLFLSNLRRRKGLFETLQAAIITLQQYPALSFTFAGTWEADTDKAEVEAMLQNCNVADRIRFPGIVTGDDKYQLLLDSDFFVFPPIEPEGHPRVVIEAMAAGLPIITTDQGAIAESVLHGETGFVVETGSVMAIVEKIQELIDNPGRRETMGAAARKRFLACYTADHAHAQLATVFHEVLN